MAAKSRKEVAASHPEDGRLLTLPGVDQHLVSERPVQGPQAGVATGLQEHACAEGLAGRGAATRHGTRCHEAPTLTSQMSRRCLMYTRSVSMISWMTLVRICCLLSGCLWRPRPASSAGSSPGVPLEPSASSSWLTRSCGHTQGTGQRGGTRPAPGFHSPGTVRRVAGGGARRARTGRAEHRKRIGGASRPADPGGNSPFPHPSL